MAEIRAGRVGGLGQRDSRQGQSESFWENEPNPRFWQNEPNQGELAERTQSPPVSPSHRNTRGMTSFHVPLPAGWNAERTRQLIAVYRFSRSSGESFVVPAGAGVDRFPGGGPFVRLPSRAWNAERTSSVSQRECRLAAFQHGR